MKTTTDIQTLHNQLADLEKQIQDLEQRLPAHSVKPSMMIELERLEDKRDAIIEQIEKINSAKK